MAGATLAAPGKPTVVSTKPADDAADVLRDADVQTRFSKAMRASTINERTFELYED
jgi:hypothetical protein